VLEAYSSYTMRERPDESAVFPLRRKVNFNAVAFTWYEDSRLDGVARAFGEAVRELWWGTSGLVGNLTCIVFLLFFVSSRCRSWGGEGLQFPGMSVSAMVMRAWRLCMARAMWRGCGGLGKSITLSVDLISGFPHRRKRSTRGTGGGEQRRGMFGYIDRFIAVIKHM